MGDYGRIILESAVRDHPESIPAKVILDNFHHFINLHTILDGKWEFGWGSYMFNGRKYEWQRETLKKQEALFRVGEKCKNVLEVGVYLGHSLLILLISNPNLKITCIDNDSRFAPKAVEYLNKMFDNRINFYLGEATNVIESLSPENKFDFVHIDADHNNMAVLKQFDVSRKISTDDAYYVFDDYEATREAIDHLLQKNIVTQLVLPNCLWTNIVTRLTAPR
jgi:hypothetical protein